LFAWLTLLPVITALPVSSQARDIFQTFIVLARPYPTAAPETGGARSVVGGLMEKVAVP
jgi:hypothetical protein